MARALLRWPPFFPSLNLKPSSSPHFFLQLPHTFLPRTAPTLSFFSSSSSPAAAANYLDLSDDDLMAQCDVGTFKSSGPGGQHRNKRESAVRICHRPTGVIAQAAEERSQHKNRAMALTRLRTKLALKGYAPKIISF
ncbi:hypothetical protein ZIOFF_058052 [Zingiber officinale]|uniref:Prokaryotic-type class I peptide chain release factors domain-containing protein n=1 Tax=Zingiber officinale TaxID=94328 RepID=A0A8J5F5W9_ZINOF|nr:hypothetical protein ZIOFF_058052 [Zingiber officinale]